MGYDRFDEFEEPTIMPCFGEFGFPCAMLLLFFYYIRGYVCERQRVNQVSQPSTSGYVTSCELMDVGHKTQKWKKKEKEKRMKKQQHGICHFFYIWKIITWKMLIKNICRGQDNRYLNVSSGFVGHYKTCF